MSKHMKRIEELKQLADKVEAGECVWPDVRAVKPVLPWGVERRIIDAYDGSLDAAKELHEAVLGDEMKWNIGEEAGRLQGDPSRWCVGIFCYRTDRYIVWECLDCPARAWLLAILRALIAQEEEKLND